MLTPKQTQILKECGRHQTLIDRPGHYLRTDSPVAINKGTTRRHFSLRRTFHTFVFASFNPSPSKKHSVCCVHLFGRSSGTLQSQKTCYLILSQRITFVKWLCVSATEAKVAFNTNKSCYYRNTSEYFSSLLGKEDLIHLSHHTVWLSVCSEPEEF